MAHHDEKTNGVHLWLLLMKAHRAVEKRSLSSIEGAGMCFSDFAILEALLHKGSLAVNTLGAKIPLTSGSATTAVDRLQSRGFVRRAGDAADRRARIVHLTAKGREWIERAFARHSLDMEVLMSALGGGERRQLARLLRKLGKHAAADPETPVKSSTTKGD